MSLAGKKALVTGGGRGIGKGCALALARHGADVAVNDRPDSPDLESTIQEIRNLGREAVPVPGNVFTRDGCEQIVADAVSALGQIDILLHNPAYSVRAPFLEHDPEEFEKGIAGTLTSGFHASQFVARHMVQRGGGGKIIFISSVQALMPYPGNVSYLAAKAGLIHMAKGIAVELMPHRINVNIIAPGWVETPGEHKHFGTETLLRDGPKLPWGRIGQPDDIGKAAAFLASDDADYVTATVLKVDGGYLYKDM